ncbi:hypothetical protein NTJ12_002606 [Flavobacterium psychrophilum]|jgi:hypothetical protein|nr:hypothetical protein [Flavobacterium psychrophilum]
MKFAISQTQINKENEQKVKIMAVYKLKAKGNYGNMSKGYEFQVNSSTIPTPNANDIEKEIERLGFNSQAKSYKSAGNFEVTKL